MCFYSNHLLQLLEKDLRNNTNLMKLLVKTLCEPSSIGFNIGDVLVMNHLPDVCVDLMKALKKSPYKDILEMHLKEELTAQRWAFRSCLGSVLCTLRLQRILAATRVAAVVPFPRVKDLISGVFDAENLISCLKIIYLTNASPAPYGKQVSGVAQPHVDFHGWISAWAPCSVLTCVCFPRSRNEFECQAVNTFITGHTRFFGVSC